MTGLSSQFLATLIFGSVLSWHPLPFILVGLALLIGSFWLPNSTSSGGHDLMQQKGTGMELMTTWDESKINRTVRSLVEGRGTEAAMSFLRGSLQRFVYNQNAQTFEKRSAFINTQIAFVESVTKLEVAKRQLLRTPREENLKDDQLGVQEQNVDQTLELNALRHELQREQLRHQIEETRYSRSNIGRPPPEPPAPEPLPLPRSPQQQREDRVEELCTREAKLQDEIERTEADRRLTEDQRQRKLNALEDQLARVHEELAELL